MIDTTLPELVDALESKLDAKKLRPRTFQWVGNYLQVNLDDDGEFVLDVLPMGPVDVAVQRDNAARLKALVEELGAEVVIEPDNFTL